MKTIKYLSYSEIFKILKQEVKIQQEDMFMRHFTSPKATYASLPEYVQLQRKQI